jgi:hypothetical protein
VALDRQAIEREDFPVGRQGYDPDEAEAHLAGLAGEEQLRRSARQRTDAPAAAASEQVRAVVEAAERSAAEIEPEADDEGGDVAPEAGARAAAAGERASAQSGDDVARLSEFTHRVRERLETMESELSALTESLRAGGERLTSELRRLEASLEEVTHAVAPRARFESDPPAVRASEPEQARAADRNGVRAHGELQPGGPEKVHGDALAGGAQVGGGSNGAHPVREAAGDAEGARLVALNMALAGRPREETERYLAEHFTLAERRRLVDEVYASVAE